jgi:transposase
VIRVSQWAEIRAMHVVEGLAKKTIARRLGLDVKTVRRALRRTTAPLERAPTARPSRLDEHRRAIVAWLRADRRISAKRIRRLLEPATGPISERTVRHYVGRVRRELFAREAFVHRTAVPGDTLEADFFEAWAEIGRVLRKVRVFQATLPASNVYFAKAYPVERLECLLDGLACAFRYFGGLTRRAVLDNLSLAVRRVLAGREREETQAFHAFRGAYPFEVDYCAPAKGNEKGSTENGVKYVRGLAFRPIPKAADFDDLNAQVLRELEADLDGRRLVDGRTAREAWEAERAFLRPLPVYTPSTCRLLARVADKFGHVHLDRVSYSVPIRFAYRPVWAKAFHDRVEIAVEGEVVATHARVFEEGAKVLDARHVLALLERKHRAVPESTAIQQWELEPAFLALRHALAGATRRPDQEWVRVLRLTESHPQAEVAEAVAEALAQGSPHLETIRLLLRRRAQGAQPLIQPAPVARADLAALEVAPPVLADYDRLGETA